MSDIEAIAYILAIVGWCVIILLATIVSDLGRIRKVMERRDGA